MVFYELSMSPQCIIKSSSPIFSVRPNNSLHGFIYLSIRHFKLPIRLRIIGCSNPLWWTPFFLQEISKCVTPSLMIALKHPNLENFL